MWFWVWQCWSVSRFTTMGTSRAPVSAGLAIAFQHCGWPCEQIYIKHTGKSLLKKKATCEVSLFKLSLNFLVPLSSYLSILPFILFFYSEPDPHHSHSGGATLPGCRWRCWGGSGEEQKASVPGASHPGARPHIRGLRLLQHSQPHRTGLGG